MFGDSTAYMLGRVTLNPLKHIDPVGTIAVPLGAAVVVEARRRRRLPVRVGEAGPVNFNNLRDPKSDMFWVAAAVRRANLLMALLWAIVLKFGGPLDQPWDFLALMAIQGHHDQCRADGAICCRSRRSTAADHGQCAGSRWRTALRQIERFGFMLVILLMATGLLN